ncbi:ATP-binding protein [Chitinilyticum piscinae]|uniref:ATP-binding protein n=1 Tax=Chitinilyticum piscinae TaxID=2866724 RepID=A0A8J7FJJ7_9NEIS|nr:ATP-binding protein [Chitinilyticum piscinae]MBE9607994.1 ATP-binding protein [Chitinilyticum piscinae]
MTTSDDKVLEYRLNSDLAAIAGLAEAVTAFLAQTPRIAMQVNLCLDELLTNTILHGFAGASGHEIAVSLKLAGDWLEIVISDDAPAFDPFTEVAPPDLDAELDDRIPGGLGVHFVRSLMDDYRLVREDGRNRILLRKNLPV